VSLILHLSDLHLGSPVVGQLDVDDKVGIGEEPGATDKSHLAHTLEALAGALRAEKRSLDAVVVSGDITKGNRTDGFEELDEFLGRLGDALPPAGRIVVVPGNHDMDKVADPGDPEKTKRFREAVRGKYLSPLLNGIDYNVAATTRPGTSEPPAEPLLKLDDAVVAAISSSDFCWTFEHRTQTKWEEVLNAYKAIADTAAFEKAKKELGGLRNHDIAKVDEKQLEELGKELDAIGVCSGNEGEDPRLRIAVLHHPIGIVSGHEEIKPYAYLTNLAKVRTFLYHRGFHVVLHGHKHANYAGWDWLVPPGGELDQRLPHRTLVLGAAGRFRVGEPALRLLEVSPDREKPVAGAPRLRVMDVKGTDLSEQLSLPLEEPVRSLAQPFVSSLDPSTPWVVKAKSADAAYQQLRDLAVDSEVPRAVISIVEDASTAGNQPTNYAETEADLALKDLVTWWQHPRPEAVHAFSGSSFNHGERLYGDSDTIKEAVQALPSSKAIAILVRPGEAGDSDREWPAFVVVQLQLRRDQDRQLLDVVGFYRKQDLELWWPVNIAELAEIQKRAVKHAHESRSPALKGKIGPGRLIAIASSGVHDKVLPQMAGTALDRSIDLRPTWIYKLADLAAHPRRDTQSEWERALEDIGEGDGDGLLIPSIGVERLREALAIHTEVEDAAPGLRSLQAEVEKLQKWSDKYAKRLARSDASPEDVEEARDALNETVDAIHQALASNGNDPGI
jgi:3',5'-cyclic AMP phosphodiesterase CpdA